MFFLTVLIFGALASFNYASCDEEQSGYKVYCRFMDESCSTRDAYHFSPVDIKKVGHLAKMKFPSVAMELEADTSVLNPQNPEKQVNIAGALERIHWSGKQDENLEMGMKVSPNNRAIILEALTSPNFDGRVEVEWVIYDFDYPSKKYFKRFHTDGNLMKYKISPDSLVYSGYEPDYRDEKPIVYSIEFAFVPEKGEQLKYSFRPNKEFTRTFE